MQRHRRAARSIVSPSLASLLLCTALPASAGMGAWSGPLYNDVHTKSSHNSYQRIESLSDQIVYHRIRSLELDLHMDGDKLDDFEVYHSLPSSNNRCHTLSGCLKNLRAIHDSNPNHEVITVFMDLKEDFQTRQNRATLDNLLATHLGSRVKTPAQLLADCPGASTLKAAVTRNATGTASDCRWPSLAELRGKFVFVLTDKTDQYADTNAEATASERRAFVKGTWSNATHKGDGFRIFYNVSGPAASNFDVWLAGYVSRSYGLESDADFRAAKDNATNFLGTNKVNYHEDPWARTHNSDLYPFECIIGTCPSGAEARSSGISLLVNSKDIHGDTDSGFYMREFYSFTDTSGQWIRWRANIAQSESHVGGEMTKGCLIARASRTSSTAPYFAVCHTGDDNQPRIQWRTGWGSGYGSASFTSEKEGVNSENMTFFQLRCLSTGGSNMTCEGWISPDDDTYYQIGSAITFNTQLTHQGVAASSHDTGKSRKFYFENLRRLPAGGSPGTNSEWIRYTADSSGWHNRIGTVHSWSSFNGLGTTSQPGPN